MVILIRIGELVMMLYLLQAYKRRGINACILNQKLIHQLLSSPEYPEIKLSLSIDNELLQGRCQHGSRKPDSGVQTTLSAGTWQMAPRSETSERGSQRR